MNMHSSRRSRGRLPPGIGTNVQLLSEPSGVASWQRRWSAAIQTQRQIEQVAIISKRCPRAGVPHQLGHSVQSAGAKPSSAEKAI
ncbi:hypothetical protein ABI069_14915, partial [Enterococcus faecium]|uniref:hypothetical protein n=1 Tax=Enterococcus faecium TaxID=1352 RepID=UPI003F433105